jgi:YD repeat-containing protein
MNKSLIKPEYHYNTNNVLVYSKNREGTEIWYNELGSIIRHKLLNGREEYYERNEEDVVIYMKDSAGNEEWYNEQGIIIHRKYSFTGREYWYNELGILIRHKDEKREQEYLYDEYGQVIEIDPFSPPLSPEVFIRDLNDNLLYRRYPNGDEVWYDTIGNVTHKRYSNGREMSIGEGS